MLSFKIRANFKIARWQEILVCRDITFLVATFSDLGGTSHPLVVTPSISVECYDVATTSFKLKVQRVFPSLATLTSSASHKSISQNNSYMYSIHFS